MNNKKSFDVVLIGCGIMSATLGALIKQLEPKWSIALYEKLEDVAQESSNPWNNAGTGHAALCELNYMPESSDGKLDAKKAISINEQFMQSKQLWSYFVSEGILKDSDSFINKVPHMTFVKGEEDVAYLKKRYEVLKNINLFKEIEYSEEAQKIAKWAPHIIQGRDKNEKIAATRIENGTDVDFGLITKQLIQYLERNNSIVKLGYTAKKIIKQKNKKWLIKFKRNTGKTIEYVEAKFVFVGSGGGALSLLQSSKINEIKGFGGFPVSGKFLRCDNPEVVAKHEAKVYGKASVGAPPMSVPHLDTRVVNNQKSLLFGPYAGFTSKFLKKGSLFDLPKSVKTHNVYPMLAVAFNNISLLKYLIGEALATKNKRLTALKEYFPDADPKDWYLITAGQRVQIMKKDSKKGGVLQFGTEVIFSQDGTIAGLLGASPGASTAVNIMLSVLENCFSKEYKNWLPRIKRMIPYYGVELSQDDEAALAVIKYTDEILLGENG